MLNALWVNAAPVIWPPIGRLLSAFVLATFALLPAQKQATAGTQLALTESYVLLFDRGSTNLSAAARIVLDDFARQVTSGNRMTDPIFIDGHTDTVGTPAANMVLSCQRALIARDYLIEAGVSAERITVVGHGETDLAVPTGDDVLNQANRRVVLLYGRIRRFGSSLLCL